MSEKRNFSKINYPKQTTITLVTCVLENHPKPGITKKKNGYKINKYGEISFGTIQNNLPGRNNPVIMKSNDFDIYSKSFFVQQRLETEVMFIIRSCQCRQDRILLTFFLLFFFPFRMYRLHQTCLKSILGTYVTGKQRQ